NEFNEKFKEEIASLARQLTVYVASNDKALLMAQIIDREKKLGRQRVQAEPSDQFEEAQDLLYLKSLDPDRISIVDVTLVNKAGGGHTYYIETPEFYDDFYMRLFGDPVSRNRRLYLVNVKEGVDYWVIRPNRK
ncbi:MAG: alpha/beta hydrolase, partial [Candidatus Omnitrophica bacterium]|nr:alpha/beta hydrolase [Candidatus Omnitrophota bacterium]